MVETADEILPMPVATSRSMPFTLAVSCAKEEEAIKANIAVAKMPTFPLNLRTKESIFSPHCFLNEKNYAQGTRQIQKLCSHLGTQEIRSIEKINRYAIHKNTRNSTTSVGVNPIPSP